MLDPQMLTNNVIAPVLRRLQLYSPAAVELVLGTAMQESKLRWLVQLGGGPGRGLWQMEPATHDDIWKNFLAYQKPLADRVTRYKGVWSLSPQLGDPYDVDELVGNLFYACAMCRVHYYRQKEELPEAGNLSGQARYWKKYYNTPLGAGTPEEYIASWHQMEWHP